MHANYMWHFKCHCKFFILPAILFWQIGCVRVCGNVSGKNRVHASPHRQYLSSDKWNEGEKYKKWFDLFLNLPLICYTHSLTHWFTPSLNAHSRALAFRWMRQISNQASRALAGFYTYIFRANFECSLPFFVKMTDFDQFKQAIKKICIEIEMSYLISFLFDFFPLSSKKMVCIQNKCATSIELLHKIKSIFALSFGDFLYKRIVIQRWIDARPKY